MAVENNNCADSIYTIISGLCNKLLYESINVIGRYLTDRY